MITQCPRRIVLCSDGTGNSSAKAEKTNVWRLFESVDQTTREQIALYDDGVGSSAIKYLALITGAFGIGLKENVLDLYKFVCRNYPNPMGLDAPVEVKPDIYGFGFSRGAFTIRLLIDFIISEGLVTYRSEEELDRNARAAYRHYRAQNFKSKYNPFVAGIRAVRNKVSEALEWVKGYDLYEEVKKKTEAAGRRDITVKFLGLYDSVDAYGMPITELKYGIDMLIWPILFSSLCLSEKVERACHALALDDERRTFHPLVFDEEAEAQLVSQGKVRPGRLTQVWFAGVHSNVGGGYPEDQLSFLPLFWIMSEAMANGLVFAPGAVDRVVAMRSSFARLYDSRAGLAAYYRYDPRQIRIARDVNGERILPIVDYSVIMRMVDGTDNYAPVTLPSEFWVRAPDGALLPVALDESKPLKLDSIKRPFAGVPLPLPNVKQETAELVRALRTLRSSRTLEVKESLDFVWATIFWRRVSYVLTMALTFVFVTYPWSRGALRNLLLTPFGAVDKAFGWSSEGKVSRFVTDLNDHLQYYANFLLEAVRDFIPGSAMFGRWIKAFEERPFSIAMILATIAISLGLSSLLQNRIRDRSRLLWNEDYKPAYSTWLVGAKRGSVYATAFAFFASLGIFIWLVYRADNDYTTLSVVGAFALLSMMVLASSIAGLWGTRQTATAVLKGGFMLAVANFLRNSSKLQRIYGMFTEFLAPAGSAALLVVACLVLISSPIYGVVNVRGDFCRVAEAGKPFTTDSLCWKHGETLEANKKYRITLTSNGDWFDRTRRADPVGFQTDGLGFLLATPLKRRWDSNWFAPIARIGLDDAEEVTLLPVHAKELYYYPKCEQIGRTTDGRAISSKIALDPGSLSDLLKCAPTPPERMTVSAVVTPKKGGPLYLYVNDAVLMMPGLTDLFVANNSGSASVKVELQQPELMAKVGGR